MSWEPTETYKARIGGLYYENVIYPITCDGEPLIRLTRDSVSGILGISLQLKSIEGHPIAEIVNNDVILGRDKRFVLQEGSARRAIIDQFTGRVWYDWKSYPREEEKCEIELACLLFGGSGYPIMLHPDRTKLGDPILLTGTSFSGFSVISDVKKGSVFEVGGPSFYFSNIVLKNAGIGIAILDRKRPGYGLKPPE